jgi:hypothetical protein
MYYAKKKREGNRLFYKGRDARTNVKGGIRGKTESDYFNTPIKGKQEHFLDF